MKAIQLVLLGLAWGIPCTAMAQLHPTESVLYASDASESAAYGYATAISGEWIVVGDLRNHAYIYHGVGGSWSEELELGPGGTSKSFGTSVAVDGDTIIINDLQRKSSGAQIGPGAAYVYRWSGADWQLEATLTASDGAIGDFFGTDVAVDGDVAVVGAQLADKAYVFERQGTAWSQAAILIGGGSVAVSGSTAVVASDKVYVSVDSGGSWTQQVALSPPVEGGASSWLGVDVEGDTLAFTSSKDIYIYERSGATWSETFHLANPSPDDGFGTAVEISPDQTLLIAGDSPFASAGAARVFRKFGSAWGEVALLTASDGSAGDELGRTSAAISLDTAVVGARRDDTPAGSNAGSVHVYDLNPVWQSIGSGLAGAGGTPTLEGNGSMEDGALTEILLEDARGFAYAPLVVGLAQIMAPFKGGVLVPTPDLVLPFTTNGFGTASFGWLWPSGIPSDASLYFQWWIQDPGGPVGFAASNGLSGTTP